MTTGIIPSKQSPGTAGLWRNLAAIWDTVESWALPVTALPARSTTRPRLWPPGLAKKDEDEEDNDEDDEEDREEYEDDEEVEENEDDLERHDSPGGNSEDARGSSSLPDQVPGSVRRSNDRIPSISKGDEVGAPTTLPLSALRR